MKSILIVIYAHYVKLIIESKKTVEVRKNKNLANAIKKLIAEQGGCWIYIYVAKGTHKLLCHTRINFPDMKIDSYKLCPKSDIIIYKDTAILNGKVVARFWCDNVEEIDCFKRYDGFLVYSTDELLQKDLEQKSCLTERELDDYLQSKNGYAIHISKLEVFDKPRELKEFNGYCDKLMDSCVECKTLKCRLLTKAPQNYCYVESEN